MKDGRPSLHDEQITSILSHGGGMRLDGSRYRTDQLTTFASFAKSGQARLTLIHMEKSHAEDLVAIASFGGGFVSFEFGGDD